MFTFPVSPEDLFEERTRQFLKWGVPSAALERVRARVRDTWSDAPGGWCYEFSAEADASERAGRLLEAAALYGAARFPFAATDARRAAHEKQLACFLRAHQAGAFPVAFQRQVLATERGAVPVHLYARRADAFTRREGAAAPPLLLVTGGVDTYKVELHRLAVALARLTGALVCAFDMPGTGESPGPLSSDGERVHLGVIDALRAELSPPHVSLIGLSFGGHWAAKLALLGKVDCAVDVGGPVGATPLDAAFLRARAAQRHARHQHDDGLVHDQRVGVSGVQACARCPGTDWPGRSTHRSRTRRRTRS